LKISPKTHPDRTWRFGVKRESSEKVGIKKERKLRGETRGGLLPTQSLDAQNKKHRRKNRHFLWQRGANERWTDKKEEAGEKSEPTFTETVTGKNLPR